MVQNWTNAEGTNYDWNRSVSEPDLTVDPLKHLNRFIIKHPHEYISVDDLKYFRRKRPPDFHTRSHICLYDKNENELPISALETEYRRNFHPIDLQAKPPLLRRSTSLRLEGLMHHTSEQRDQYHWYSPEDWQICRPLTVKNPENLHLGGDIDMNPEYRSSYISYPLVDRATKILPREMFRIEAGGAEETATRKARLYDKSPEEIAAINKLADDKYKRDIAAQEQHKCHLQIRNANEELSSFDQTPSEYKRQFVPFQIEKAHSIPQIGHIKIQGKFAGVPEYQDKFKNYTNYSKSAPIKKNDNLKISGSEAPIESTNNSNATLPEYREKFCDPPKDLPKEKLLKTDDHLYPRGEFTKDIPEYYESYRDPQVKQVPERGKCREPYLRLKGKIEFNPEYRNTYLDFPRSRPITKKPMSTFRLPMSTSSTTTNSPNHRTVSKEQSPRQKQQRLPQKKQQRDYAIVDEPISSTTDITKTPEYRRARTLYQLRERTPQRKVYESDGGGNSKPTSNSNSRKATDSSFDFETQSSGASKNASNTHKRRTPRREISILEKQQLSQNSFENVGHSSKKPAKYGRRASVLQNAANCRETSRIIEGNPKYALPKTTNTNYDRENQNRQSFVVLEQPCKRSNWMKKTWYET